MQQSVLKNNIAKFNAPNYLNTDPPDHVDVFAASIKVSSAKPAYIRPIVIKSRKEAKPIEPATVAQSTPSLPKSSYEIALETQKRIQALRAQSELQNLNMPIQKIVIEKSRNNWKVIIGYSVALILLALMIGPLFNHVATALAAF